LRSRYLSLEPSGSQERKESKIIILETVHDIFQIKARQLAAGLFRGFRLWGILTRLGAAVARLLGSQGWH
jgi:hypothetical protein